MSHMSKNMPLLAVPATALVSSANASAEPLTRTSSETVTIPQILFTALPVDVILHISIFLLCSEISRLSRTCHCLRDIILPEILRAPTHIPKKHMLSFASCVSLPGRAALLRTCSLDAKPNNPSSPPIAYSIISNARNLTALSLRHLNSAEEFTSALRSALSALTRLEDLYLADLTPAYTETLADASPSIRSVSLQFMASRTMIADPLPMLYHHASRLQELRLHDVSLNPRTGAPVFSALRKLTISSFHLSEGIATLVHLFPSVEELWLGSMRRLGGSSYPVRTREENLAWQATHGSLPRDLRFIYADYIPALRTLGPSCAVTRLDVYWFRNLDPNAIAETVSTTRPRCLGFSIDARDYGFLGELQSRAGTLTHLIVRCSEVIVHSGTLPMLLRILLTVLKTCSVTHVLLRVALPQAAAEQGLFPFRHPLARARERVYHTIKRVVEEDDLPPNLLALFLETEGDSVKAWIHGEQGRSWSEADGVRARQAFNAENEITIGWRV